MGPNVQGGGEEVSKRTFWSRAQEAVSYNNTTQTTQHNMS